MSIWAMIYFQARAVEKMIRGLYKSTVCGGVEAIFCRF
jgi:hypothetical protein